MPRFFPSFSCCVLAALLVCSGCRLWNARAPAFQDPLSDEMLDALGGRLDGDGWRPNAEWSLLEGGVDAAGGAHRPASRRWVFGDRAVEDALGRLDSSPRDGAVEKTGTKEAAGAKPASGEQWDGFWPLNVEQVLDSLDARPPMFRELDHGGLGERYLRQLARENTRRGWNAAILLAQRDPIAAGEFLPVLERIVSSYPKPRGSAATDAFDAGPAAVEAVEKPDVDSASSDAADDSIDALVERVTRQLLADAKPDAEQAGEKKGRDKSGTAPAELLDRLLTQAKGATGLPAAHKPEHNLETISESMRAAAAEAWCLALAARRGDPLDDMAPAGRLLERADLPNGVRAELWRGVARRVPPRLIPRLANALRVSNLDRQVPLEIRRAGVEACLVHALERRRGAVLSGFTEPGSLGESLWPETILNCRTDTDAAIRRTFGRWAAVANYRDSTTDASAILEAQLHDHQPQVRLDALASLGWLGTDAARQKLREEVQRPEAIVRAAAARGLSRWGVDELAPLIADPSAVVRAAAAEQLADHPSIRSYFLLHELLRDGDLKVQQAAVTSVEKWPDDPALKLLLFALRDAAGPTRRLAFQQLRERRAIGDAFGAFDSPLHEVRVQAVDDLAAKLDVPLQFLDRFPDGRPAHPASDPLRVREVESLLQVATDLDQPPALPQRADALSKLAQLTADDVPIIEEFLLKTSAGDAGFAYRELLPRLSPAHAALNDLMEQPDLQRKRQAAQRLREAAAQHSLSRLAVRRLLPLLDGRQDTLIWRDAMTAIMPDATDDHAQAALRALNDERAEIQLLGCQYVLRHPRPQFAHWLQQHGLFRHADRRVRLTAVKAAGLCGNPGVLEDRADSPAAEAPSDVVRGQTAAAGWKPGLRSLLTDPDQETRIAAAASMARLGDRLGMEELSRLCWSPEPKIRQQAVLAMGETESTWFIEPLIRRGWTERHVDVRRAILNSLDQLTLPGKRPVNLVDESGYDGKIKRWLEWWEESRGSRVKSRELRIESRESRAEGRESRAGN